MLNFIGNLCVGTLMMTFKGFVISKLWQWYVVAGFGLTPISVPVGMGLSMLAAILVYKPNEYVKSEEEISYFEKVAVSLIYYLLALATGFGVQLAV
jgi:hypothetical protein